MWPSQYAPFSLQMLMNAQAPKQTSVIQTLRVTTLKGPILVAVLMDIKAMVKIAQVSKYRLSFLSSLWLIHLISKSLLL